MTDENQIRSVLEAWAQAVRDVNMPGILASHTAFRETVRKWTEVSEGAYIAI